MEIFVDRASEAVHFNDFFTGATVADLASLGIGDKERNMLLVLFLNLYYEHMLNLEKRPYIGRDAQLRFIDSMLLVDEADNIMKYNFDVLRKILLQGREFGVGVLLASKHLSHFRTREIDYAELLLTLFVHKVPNVTARELEAIGLNKVPASTVEQVKSLDVHECLYKTLDVPGRFIRSWPFHVIVGQPAGPERGYHVVGARCIPATGLIMAATQRSGVSPVPATLIMRRRSLPGLVL